MLRQGFLKVIGLPDPGCRALTQYVDESPITFQDERRNFDNLMPIMTR